MTGNTSRAEVVGSLLRPPYLLRAQRDLSEERITPGEFKRVEDRAVDEALALQERAGLDVVTDGEQRRLTFLDPLTRVDGLGPFPGMPARAHDDQGHEAAWQSPRSVIDWIRPAGGMMTAEEFTYSRARWPHADVPVKVTLPSPIMSCALWSPEHSPIAYRNPFSLVRGFAGKLREEIVELARLGCQYVQIDAPELLQLYGEDGPSEFMQSLGWPLGKLAAEAPGVLESMITKVPGVRFALHICRGSVRGMWMADGGYSAAARELFPRLGAFDAVLLDYDDATSAPFDAIAELPRNVTAVLGLVSTRRPGLETVHDLGKRVDQAAQFADLSRLAVSTQCGFAADIAGNPVSAEDQAGKLRLVAETAREVWK
jgi:5-methyltetrahydropteroyltriglutamate--homocysteine methyltransferase